MRVQSTMEWEELYPEPVPQFSTAAEWTEYVKQQRAAAEEEVNELKRSGECEIYPQHETDAAPRT